MRANELQIYLIASQRIASLWQCELRSNKFSSFEPTTLWVANLQISNLRGFKSTSIDVNITFERTHQNFTTFCILRSFMKLMSDILDIFMFVPDIYSVVVINLNRIVTLDSNQGGAVLYSLENRNEFAYEFLRGFSCRKSWNNVQSSAISEHFQKITYQFSTKFTEVNGTKRLETVTKKIFSFL